MLNRGRDLRVDREGEENKSIRYDCQSIDDKDQLLTMEQKADNFVGSNETVMSRPASITSIREL